MWAHAYFSVFLTSLKACCFFSVLSISVVLVKYFYTRNDLSACECQKGLVGQSRVVLSFHEGL